VRDWPPAFLLNLVYLDFVPWSATEFVEATGTPTQNGRAEPSTEPSKWYAGPRLVRCSLCGPSDGFAGGIVLRELLHANVNLLGVAPGLPEAVNFRQRLDCGLFRPLVGVVNQ
jgi:hypothetical protein